MPIEDATPNNAKRFQHKIEDGVIVLILVAASVLFYLLFFSTQAYSHEIFPVYLVQIKRDNLEITNGRDFLKETKSGFLTIDGHQSRAVEKTGQAKTTMIQFRYRGPASSARNTSPSGQIGLKLRAKNGCNLLYVMWVVGPEERLKVQMKSNPGDVNHEDCGTCGYTTLVPESNANPFPPISSVTDQKTHRLLAKLEPLDGNDYRLIVYADWKEVWRGIIRDMPPEIEGPAGIRTDGGNFIFRFFTDNI
ncbi:hypothetical protein [Candidatus Thiosymbion oneisti]|uniref:hypothetical protein n=1 Tax=Candidatus Thiosymbion oneisti TaxID=589554 RepID=UPI00114C89EE|nr:hypothetical protein [Candidatus Thiosymbion oneisti]